MTDGRLTVLLLPGATDDADALTTSLRSVRPELGDDAPFAVVRDVERPGQAALVAAAGAAGVLSIDAEAVASVPGLVGFVRIGDRWRPGALAARRRPLVAHPTAVLSIAGHRRVEPGESDDGLTVPAPLPPLEPGALILRPQVEASAVLVAARVLDAAAVALLHRPHGDAVVWSRLVAHHGHLPSGEVAADVRLDPDRHGVLTAARIDAMLDAITAADDDDPAGHSSVRRELLRRLFLEAEQHNEVDVTTWLGPVAARSPRARGVVDDLQWALRRQREALLAERVRWTAGTVRDDEVLRGSLDLERIRLSTTLAEFHGEMRVRDSTIQRLQAELAARDSTIERLRREGGV